MLSFNAVWHLVFASERPILIYRLCTI